MRSPQQLSDLQLHRERTEWEMKVQQLTTELEAARAHLQDLQAEYERRGGHHGYMARSEERLDRMHAKARNEL